jgi:hypothetical protein
MSWSRAWWRNWQRRGRISWRGKGVAPMSETKPMSERRFRLESAVLLSLAFVIMPLVEYWVNRNDEPWLDSTTERLHDAFWHFVFIVVALLVIYFLTRWWDKGEAIHQTHNPADIRSWAFQWIIFILTIAGMTAYGMVSSSGWGWAGGFYALTAMMMLVVFLRYRRLIKSLHAPLQTWRGEGGEEKRGNPL